MADPRCLGQKFKCECKSFCNKKYHSLTFLPSSFSRHFTPAEVAVLWTTPISDDADYLICHWPLDEGYGPTAHDTIAGIKLTTPEKPWPIPDWVPSDAPTLGDTDGELPGTSLHLNSSIIVCARLFLSGPLYDNCELLSSSTTDAYYELCLDAADDAGEDEAYDVAFTYADICQVALNLTTWPAFPLCLEVPDLRAGSQCMDDCLNGIKVSDTCQCNDGFFGDECQYVCPGGSLSACSHHGLCTSLGQCQCELNWQGWDDCSACTADWSGIECTLVQRTFLSITYQHHIFTALITVHTQYILFDGVVFYFGAVGEYHLIRISTLNVQVRQVPCFTQGTCINALALHSQNGQIVFHAPYISGQLPVLWLNRRVFSITAIDVEINSEWRIILVNNGKYRLSSVIHDMSIDIQVIGVHLQLVLSVPEQVCIASQGLLGNCNGDITDDLIRPLNETAQQDINAEVAATWLVPPEDSLFIHQYDIFTELALPTGGVHSLLIDNTGAITDPLNGTFGNTSLVSAITVDFHVKVGKAGGVILSMSFDQTVALIFENTLKIYVGLISYETSISLTQDSWAHIYFIINVNGSLQLYCQLENNTISTYRVEVAPFPEFLASFRIALGQLIIQPTEHNVLLLPPFLGEIDELRIWSTPFHPALIASGNQINLYAFYETDSLMGLYKFDKANTQLQDSLGRQSFQTPSDPWPYPIKISSDADITFSVSDPFSTDFDDDQLETEAKEICAVFDTRANNTSTGICPNATSALMDFLYLSCLRAVTVSGDTDAAFALILATAEFCSSANGGHFNYIPFCELFQQELPTWLSQYCETDCIFGSQLDDGNCTCNYGYWGQDCAFDCPGGHVSPCNNNGRCLTDGTCKCLPNWRGDDCSQCGDGWFGLDCSLGAVIKVHIHEFKTVLAYLSGQGRIVTFDGASILLYVGYDYNILSNDQFEIKVRYSTCVTAYSFSTCYDAISIRHLGDLLTIRADVNAPHGLYVWLNYKIITLDYITTISYGFNIRRLSIYEYEIKVSHLSLNISILQSELYVAILAPVEVCVDDSVTGLLSSCSVVEQLHNSTCNSTEPAESTTNSTCEFSGTQSNIDVFTSSFIAEQIYSAAYESHHWLLPVQGAGLYLHFDDSIAVSETIQDFPTELFSLELYVLPHSHDGVLISYTTTTHVFALILSNGILQIYSGTTLYSLDLQVQLNVWQQITLVWQESILTLEVYLFDPQGEVRVNAVKFQASIFLSGGNLAIGQWYTFVPMITPSLPVGPFKGGLDEIRLFTRISNPSVVTSSWKFNADLDTPDLTNLWKMNTGIGESIVDITGKADFGPVDSHPPVWRISDDPYTSRITNPALFPTFSDEILETNAYDKCSSIFQHGLLYSSCVILGDTLLSNYYMQCLHDIAFYSDVDAAIQSTISIATSCMNELTLSYWPAQYLCNDFPTKDFPYWIGVRCDIPCYNGRRSANNDSLCECDDGYWGAACENVCPGGALMPCSGHGECATFRPGSAHVRSTGKEKTNWTKTQPMIAAYAVTDGKALTAPQLQSSTTLLTCAKRVWPSSLVQHILLRLMASVSALIYRASTTCFSPIVAASTYL